ncbi:MAG: rhodanese [Candidatus Fluviicola riflensis]|nr:MAG: rhodanese [Candidatus Fluviicola riflensis]OGS77812.1 MAG: rhodanese [Candidatus Fluviicola riflensis]OGS84877.1 MAG: rhodanese [Fluviicola sp. RIFCSPHIGHO2_01_FULL_43_53]OGS89149.1 MAG: rhodanese [Fluviicola sp. RIFCSPHIGHO2_12_FULL_43_24]
MSLPEITVAELQKLFEVGTKINVLDIRPQEQRDEWKITDSIHENAYNGLINGDSTILDSVKLDKTIPVVTVCAGGKTSLIAAEILNKKGYKAYSLQGGMKAWNYAWSVAEVQDEKLKLIQIRRVAKGCISYIIGSDNEAIVVDAALDPEVYITLAKSNGWTIKYVMDTHIHADYISRTSELASVSGAAQVFLENADVDYPFTPLKNGELLTFGISTFKTIHTPGHTTESICYSVNGKYLLTGDTLFTEGVGRPDLKADKEQAILKANQLFDSLEIIKSLKDDTLILPAHSSQSIAFDKKIIGAELSELKESISLLKLPKEEFVEQTILRIPQTPPNYLQIASLNKSGNYNGINPADLEAGANRCAIS